MNINLNRPFVVIIKRNNPAISISAINHLLKLNTVTCLVRCLNLIFKKLFGLILNRVMYTNSVCDVWLNIKDDLYTCFTLYFNPQYVGQLSPGFNIHQLAVLRMVALFWMNSSQWDNNVVAFDAKNNGRVWHFNICLIHWTMTQNADAIF